MSVVANVAINVDSRDAVGKLRLVQAQSQQTERAIGGLGAAVGKLAAAFAAVQAVKFVFVQAAEIESQRRSLEVLTGSAQKATQIIKELQDLGAVTPFTSTELIDSAKRLQAFGVEADKVVETTRRLADVSGATGAELQGLVTAYGQVQAKGRLQGEELLQFQERGVALQEELRRMYGLSGEEFQKALSKGRIGAEAVEVAVQRLTSAGGKYANGAIAQSETLNGKLSTLQDSFQRLAQNIGTFFAPVFKFLIDGINAFIERVNSAARLQAGTQAYQEAAIRTKAKFGARVMNPFDTEVQQYRARLEKSLLPAMLGAGGVAAPSAPKTKAPPPLLAAAGSGGGATGGKTAANEAKKLAEELQRSVERGDDLFRQFSRQAALLGNITEEERKRLQIQYDFQDRAREIGELKNNEQKTNLTQLNDEIRRLQLLELQTDEIKKQLELFYERAGFSGQPKMLPSGAGAFRTDINLDPNAKETRMDEMRKKLDDLVKTENQVYLGAQAIGEAFGTAFKGVASGAMTAQEALAGMMSSIADHFLDMAAQIITQQMTMIIYGTIMKALGLMGGAGGGLFSGAGPVSGTSVFGPAGAGANFNPIAFGGGMKLFAEGGFVTGPTSAVVGEGGEPEYIIPASKMRSAMSRYAAGARGSAVIPTGDDTSAGGGTATMAPSAIDVRYTVERINSVDYVTADQFRTGMAQAAQQGATQGEQRTLRRLQQSRATRSRLGMN